MPRDSRTSAASSAYCLSGETIDSKLSEASEDGTIVGYERARKWHSTRPVGNAFDRDLRTGSGRELPYRSRGADPVRGADRPDRAGTRGDHPHRGGGGAALRCPAREPAPRPGRALAAQLRGGVL